MKARPIIFSGEMVRAILAGQKTQTRRVVKPQPDYYENRLPDPGVFFFEGKEVPEDIFLVEKCPYGQPGDLLWVRETWRVGAWRAGTVDTSVRGEYPVWGRDNRIALDYAADDHSRCEWLHVSDAAQHERLVAQSIEDAMRAGFSGDDIRWSPGESPCRWRPSIHMPRWASRLTIRVTDVRVERLWKISEEDAEAEGTPKPPRAVGSTAMGHFKTVWNHINTAKGYGWDSNPWVWVLEFESIHSNVDRVLAKEAAA